jgi:hypothetical protein
MSLDFKARATDDQGRLHLLDHAGHQFDRRRIALAAYESEAYKKALQALGSGAERDFRVVGGCSAMVVAATPLR